MKIATFFLSFIIFLSLSTNIVLAAHTFTVEESTVESELKVPALIPLLSIVSTLDLFNLPEMIEVIQTSSIVQPDKLETHLDPLSSSDLPPPSTI